MFEGLFRAFSPHLELTLDQAHKVDPKAPLKITPETVKDTMVFKLENIIQMSAIDVDLDYAVKGMGCIQ